MINDVANWVQEGRLWVWQYAKPRNDWRGWHVSADPVGCRSIQLLLNLMAGGEPSHRTLNLAPLSATLLNGIGYVGRCEKQYDRMRISFQPEAPAATLEPDSTRLQLTVGDRYLRKLVAAFTSLEVGDGDFGISFSDDKKAARWMFWWPPREADRA